MDPENRRIGRFLYSVLHLYSVEAIDSKRRLVQLSPSKCLALNLLTLSREFVDCRLGGNPCLFHLSKRPDPEQERRKSIVRLSLRRHTVSSILNRSETRHHPTSLWKPIELASYHQRVVSH